MEQSQEEWKEGSPPVATTGHQHHQNSSSDQYHHQNHLYQEVEEPGVVSSVTNTCSTTTATTPSTPDLPTTSTTATTLAMDEEALEEQEALEQTPSPHSQQAHDELVEDGVEAEPVVSSPNMKVGSQGRDECDGAGGMFYYYCPLPLRAPWRNMYRSKKCVVYGVMLAGLCCLVLVLSVVIWRVSTPGGAPKGNVNNGKIALEEQGKYLKPSKQKGTLEDVPNTPTQGTGPLVAATDSVKYKESHSEVKRFTANGSDFFKILHTDTISDSIIVGARNMVYNISLTKSRELKVNKHIAWESEDHIVRICRSRRKSAEDCQNYIRLVVNQTSSDLFVCGTNAFKPECRVYRSVPGTYEEIDNHSGVAICPYDPHQNNTYTHAGGSLYTATIADANGRDSLIYRNPTRTVQHDSQMLNDPDFVSSFEYEDNVYFFFREFAVEYINCGKAIYSRVGRVCKKDRGGGIILRDIWTSFFKVRLNCSIPGDFPFYFDEIQSTSILGSGHFKPTMDPSNRTDMIYAVFNTPENSISGSAVCAFLMSDIIAAFEGGFKEQKSVYSTWLAVNEQDTPKPHPAMCVNDSKQLPIQTVNFIKSHPLMDRAVAAQGNRPILVQTSITSRMTQIAIDWQRQAVDGKSYDVLFIGKNDGTVLKAINRGIGSKIDTVIIEEIRVFAPGHAVTGLQVYRSEKEGQELIEHLIVVSRSEIKTIPLHRCGQQSTCRACVALRDPYCSWDQNRCRANTLHGEQSIDKGIGCQDEKDLGGENAIASSSSSAPTSTPCVCPEQRVVVHPTVDSQRGTSTTTTENKDANRIVNPDDSAHGDENSIPNVGLQRKDPEVGASTQVRGDTVSASTLAISLVFSILIALIVGFVAGYRTSVYRHKEGQDDFFSMGSPKAEGLKNLNRFEDSNRYNTHDYLPQPRKEKQLNVVFNPLKPNSKLPNGSAQTEVQNQKPKKVYL